MEVIGAIVRQSESFGYPELGIRVSGEIPPIEELGFVQRGNLFVAECDGFVGYFGIEPELEESLDDGTLNGHVIWMRDDTPRLLRWPMDSYPSVVNGLFPELQVVGAVFDEHAEQLAWPDWCGFALTLPRAMEVLRNHRPEFALGPHNDRGEVIWRPYLIPGAAPSERFVT